MILQPEKNGLMKNLEFVFQNPDLMKEIFAADGILTGNLRKTVEKLVISELSSSSLPVVSESTVVTYYFDEDTGIVTAELSMPGSNVILLEISGKTMDEVTAQMPEMISI